jgi:diaminopimelate decarboxylase
MRKWWERNNLCYKKEKLFMGKHNCERVAKKFGTPLYLYDGKRFIENARRLYSALKKHSDRRIKIQFMCKANPALGLLGIWNKFGYKYVSVSSIFEAKLAIKAGINPRDITFVASVGTSDRVLKIMKKLNANIVADSFSQIERLRRLGINKIGIRWNPGIGTGRIPASGKKFEGRAIQFGISEEKVIEAFQYAEKEGMKIIGIAQHVGSQIATKKDIRRYFRAITKLINLLKKLEMMGHRFEYVCFGGGLSVPYKKEDRTFPIGKLAQHIFREIKGANINTGTVILEPGRYLTADMGILLTRINLIEEKEGTLFVGVDAGVNLVPRLLFHKRYHTPHKVVCCTKRDGNVKATICGTLLFTGDNFGSYIMPKIKVGDYLAFLNVGAYNPSFEFHFGWPFAKEVLIFGNKIQLIRKEDTFVDYSHNQFLLK